MGCNPSHTVLLFCKVVALHIGSRAHNQCLSLHYLYPGDTIFTAVGEEYNFANWGHNAVTEFLGKAEMLGWSLYREEGIQTMLQNILQHPR
jgi:hypothetical protein